MKAIIKAERNPGNIILIEKDIPVPNDDEVLIKIKKAGICGTDFHIYKWDEWSQNRINPPITLGHELAGVIEKTGKNAKKYKVGDRVSAEGHIVCHQCKSCLSGLYHICDNVKIIGVDIDGCFAEYMCMPESNIWPLGEYIPDKYGAIMDPLGNAMHTVMAQPVKNRNVLITGAGSIGLFATAIARSMGANKIVVSEPNEMKSGIAMKIGADSVINPLEENTENRIKTFFGGHGPDVVLEMSGFKSAVELAFNVIAKGGDLALLGLSDKKITIDMNNNIIFKGITVRGINGRRMYETWQQCDSYLKEYRSNIDPVITHEIGMEDINRGFEMMAANQAVKVVLNI